MASIIASVRSTGPPMAEFIRSCAMRHALSNGITLVQRVRLDEPNLRVPRL